MDCPDVSLKIRTLLKRFWTITAQVLRHFATLLSQVTIQRAFVRVGPVALETGVRLLEIVPRNVSRKSRLT